MGKILRLLEKEGAVYQDRHFVYSGGNHGSQYVNLRPLYPRTGVVLPIAEALVTAHRTHGGTTFDVLIGPDFGGNVLAEVAAATVAMERGPDSPISMVRTRKRGKGFMVHPGRHYEPYLAGCRALVVEDVLTSGGSVMKVIRLVRRHGGTVVGVAGVVNRGGVTAKMLGVPHFAAVEDIDFEDYPPGDCPYCKEARPIVVDVGRGAKFQALNPDYKGGYIELAA